LLLVKSCSVAGGNFGDDFNLQLWERIFPNLQKLEGRVHFYGIGTLLGGHHETTMKKVVLGAGLGETGNVASDTNWEFRWVRGPLTAREFGLPVESAIGDPAILWPELHAGHDANGPVGFIPHHATWDTFDWGSVAAKAGLLAINPHQTPDQVISQMRNCSGIMAESLHGAICADAMAIPWTPCILAHRFNEFKWRDWMETINRPYAAVVIDRPLVREVSPVKSIANRVARLVRFKRSSRYPALRPIAASTNADVRIVALALKRHSINTKLFCCSDPALIARQRQKMYARCSEFAKEYQLEFLPA
jgi:succinoglycan biosynthesis protein ExoV